ncbi:ATP-binding protein [Pseudonocardia humida]|uniref:AAA family ATPase n=1 Tax=Pseudonocardia humida TaxID=2800819 RepID=A0ABT1A9X5_9PSEU|nr:AAA family ATPase [Pseudonocardia humida]MCO1659756.1 AAA family ATPase [Pseudonocardia humida]
MSDTMSAVADAGEPTERVRIELLGTFRVVVGDREVDRDAWPGRRAAELVQLLALAEHRRLQRDQVVEALWPHLTPEAGAANLRKSAHQARQALGRPDAVVLGGGRVALLPSAEVAVEVDAALFCRLAEAALRSRSPAAAAAAAGACTGELLPDARYEEWTQGSRARVHALQVEVLRLAGQWRRLVEVEPTDEQAHQVLMRDALRAGHRHAAIRWYGRLRTSLERELGLAPGPRSQALYEECVAGLGPASTAYVGRQVELARAAVALRGAEPGALVVRGPAGIGKSALCAQVTAMAARSGRLVVSVVAVSGSGPYAPLAAAVEDLLRRDRSLLDAVPGSTRSVLAGLTPLARPAQPPEQGLNRHMVIGAVHRLLMVAATPAGALLVVDDAHLADDATTEACAQLARTGGPRPLLVALAHRPEPVRAALAQGVAGLERAGRGVVIDLGPMPREDLEALVVAGAPEPPDDRVMTRIVETAQGNPFFALELVRAGGAGDALAVPRSVWETVTTRFLDLDAATTAMLRRIAVAGGDLDPGGVLALTGLAESDAFALLDAGLEAGALVVVDGRYRFRHELVRRALAEEVPPHHRIAMHRDIARRLAGAGAEPALVARHWLDGDRPDEAVGWLLAAARRAAGPGAFADALRHLDTLLGHDARHPDALCLRAEALDALGDMRAPAAYGLAAEAVGEPAAQEIRSKQALAQIKRGDPPGALRTMRGLAPVTVEGRLAHALAWAGAAVLGFADPETGTAKAAESRRLALESGDAPSLVIASWAQAAAAHARGELRASVHADLLETAALPELATAVFDGHLCINQRLLYGARPYPDVIAFADAFAAEAERLGAARGRAYAVTLRGEALLLSGRLTEAETDLAEAARLSRANGGAVGESLALQRLAEAALYRGDLRGAEVLLDEALAVARESDVGFHLLDRIYGTRIAAAADPDAALAVLDDAEDAVRGPLETCPGCRITLVVPGAIAAARAGDLDRAAEYETIAQWLADVVMRLPGWDAALQEVRGHRAQAAGERAAPHFAAAAAGFAAAGQRLDEARCTTLANGSARLR